MKKVIALNSGGLDSACLSKYLKDKGFYIISVFINLNAINTESSRKAAIITAEKFCNEYREINLDFGLPINYDLGGEPRGAPFLSNLVTILGLSLARRMNILEVYAGLKGDVLSKDFINQTNSLLGSVSFVTWVPALVCPFKDMQNYQEVLNAVNLTYSDVKYTHSCNVLECGECNKCKERRQLETIT